MVSKMNTMLGQDHGLVQEEQCEDHPKIERDGEILFNFLVDLLLQSPVGTGHSVVSNLAGVRVPSPADSAAAGRLTSSSRDGAAIQQFNRCCNHWQAF